MKFASLSFLFLLLSCSKNSPELEAKYKQAMIHFHKKELNESLKTFLEIKKDNPDYKDTRLFIGKIYYYAGKFEEASEVLSKASTHNEANINISIWNLKSLLAFKKDIKEKELILVQAEKLAELDSSNIELLNILARLYLDTKKVDKAMMTYRRILLFEEDLSIAHFELSKLFESNGLSTEKEFHLEKAILLSNNNKKLLEIYKKGQKDEPEVKKK